MADEEAVNKLSEECDEECKNEKKKSFEIIDQLSSELDRQTLESDYKEITNSSFAFTLHHIPKIANTTNQKRLTVVKSELEIIKNGIRSLSKTELVRKTVTVLNQVLESVKYLDFRDSGEYGAIHWGVSCQNPNLNLT